MSSNRATSPAEDTSTAWRDYALEVIAGAGAGGITPQALLDALAGAGYTVVRQTVQKWLADATDAGIVRKLGRGLYALPDGDDGSSGHDGERGR